MPADVSSRLHSYSFITTLNRFLKFLTTELGMQQNCMSHHTLNIACEASWFDSILNRTSDSIRIDGPIRNFRIVRAVNRHSYRNDWW